MKLVYALLVLCSLLVVGFGIYSVPRPRIQKESIGRIQKGMDQRQVEAILGGPPGDYGPESVACPTSGVLVPQFPDKEETWVAGYIAVSVLFDADGKVVCVRESSRMVGEATWLTKVRDWLRL